MDKQPNKRKTVQSRIILPLQSKQNLARDRSVRSDSRVPVRNEIEIDDVDQSVLEYLVEMIHDKPSAVRAQSLVVKIQSDFIRRINGRELGNCGATEEEEEEIKEKRRVTARSHI